MTSTRSSTGMIEVSSMRWIPFMLIALIFVFGTTTYGSSFCKRSPALCFPRRLHLRHTCRCIHHQRTCRWRAASPSCEAAGFCRAAISTASSRFATIPSVSSGIGSSSTKATAIIPIRLTPSPQVVAVDQFFVCTTPLLSFRAPSAFAASSEEQFRQPRRSRVHLPPATYTKSPFANRHQFSPRQKSGNNPSLIEDQHASLRRHHQQRPSVSRSNPALFCGARQASACGRKSVPTGSPAKMRSRMPSLRAVGHDDVGRRLRRWRASRLQLARHAGRFVSALLVSAGECGHAASILRHVATILALASSRGSAW